jgi:demethylmenaquinone methyltransferase / 2-methoxy-6-polyprenyl-1,4-benzoquinol methylase
MFGRIARRYDLANRVLSLGIDRYWRFKLVQAVKVKASHAVLDLATGSGDVAFALARCLPAAIPIVGMDFCAPMLVEAEAKLAAFPQIRGRVRFALGDALQIPAADAGFDAVTIAFGLRNVADRPACLAEMRRVLRPGGHLFVLEFSQPWAWVRPFYAFHMRFVAPAVAGWITGDRAAYDYLRTSIAAFPDHNGLSSEIRAAGFASVGVTRMTMGIVALHVARRDGPVS